MVARGRCITLYLMDGIPSGRIKCTITNWTGVVYKIPRTELDKCKERKDLAQSGVYLLFGTSDDTGGSVVYVGQADVRKNGNGILERLQEHKRNSDKDYWTEAVVFTTSNNSFGATEISWLESHFCTLAKQANRYEVKNGNEPSPGKPKEEIISDLEEFSDYAMLVMGALGHKVFEPIVPRTHVSMDITTEGQLFYCHRNGLEGKGKPTSDGFVVFAGSRISLEIADYVSNGDRKLRAKYAASIDQNGMLLDDVEFSSPSAAATFVIGKNANGLVTWKTSEGKTLKEIENSEAYCDPIEEIS